MSSDVWMLEIWWLCEMVTEEIMTGGDGDWGDGDWGYGDWR